MSSFLNKLKEECTCNSCHQLLSDPTLLPCLHTYCRRCIHNLACRPTTGSTESDSNDGTRPGSKGVDPAEQGQSGETQYKNVLLSKDSSKNNKLKFVAGAGDEQDASRKVKSPNTAEGREVKEGERDEVKVVEDGKEGEIEGTGLRDDGAGVVLQCPECQHRCVFDGRGDLTSSLPSLSHVARSTAMYKALHKLEERESDDGRKMDCEMCYRGSPATSFCFACSQLVCEYCHQVHHIVKSYKDHRIVSIDDLQYSNDLDLSSVSMHTASTEQVVMCSRHLSSQVKLYCHNCQLMICSDCGVDVCREHTYLSLKDEACDRKEHLLRGVEELQVLSSDSAKASESIACTTQEIVDEGERLCQRIESFFDKLVETLLSKKKLMLSDCKETTSAKTGFLQSQRKKIDSICNEFEVFKAFVEQMGNNCSPMEYIQVEPTVFSRMEDLKEKLKALSLKPVESPNLVLCLPDIENLFSSWAEQCELYKSVPCPSLCSLDFKQSIVHDKPLCFSLMLRDKHGQPCVGHSRFSVSAKLVPPKRFVNKIKELEFTRRAVSPDRLEFMSVVPPAAFCGVGVCSFSVLLDGCHVSGSPSAVSVPKPVGLSGYELSRR